MNKEGIEIMSDINLQIKDLQQEVENWKKQYLELKENYDAIKCVSVEKLQKEINDLKEELEMEKQENELYMEYLDVSDAEEAKRKFSKYVSQN